MAKGVFARAPCQGLYIPTRPVWQGCCKCKGPEGIEDEGCGVGDVRGGDSNRVGSLCDCHSHPADDMWCSYEAKMGAEFGKLEEMYRLAEWRAQKEKRGIWARSKTQFVSPYEYKKALRDAGEKVDGAAKT